MLQSLRIGFGFMQKLTEDERMYILTKGCTSTACFGFTSQFEKVCKSQRLEVLNNLPKELVWQSS